MKEEDADVGMEGEKSKKRPFDFAFVDVVKSEVVNDVLADVTEEGSVNTDVKTVKRIKMMKKSAAMEGPFVSGDIKIKTSTSLAHVKKENFGSVNMKSDPGVWAASQGIESKNKVEQFVEGEVWHTGQGGPFTTDFSAEETMTMSDEEEIDYPSTPESSDD